MRSNPIQLVLIDNYDSFTYNLYQLLGSLPEVDIQVFRNDEIEINQLLELTPDAIILSPGPGSPTNHRDFGICRDIIIELQDALPILGVCLGHQGLGYLLGAKIINASKILHGKTSTIQHDGSGLFADIPNKINVARYHSLIINPEDLPESLQVTAVTSEGEIMAITHREYPLYGVQFHPESFMTEYSVKMMQNFIKIIIQHKTKLIEV